MSTQMEMDRYIARADNRIKWIIGHPSTSDWVQQALSIAKERDPAEVLNGLELLSHLLRDRAEVQIERAFLKTSENKSGAGGKINGSRKDFARGANDLE